MAQSTGVSPMQTGLRSQTGNSNATAQIISTNGSQPQAAWNQNHNPNIPNNLNPNISVKVDGAGLNAFVPVIPEVCAEDIKELFKVKYLTKLEREPTFNWIKMIECELARNALAVECSFGVCQKKRDLGSLRFFVNKMRNLRFSRMDRI